MSAKLEHEPNPPPLASGLPGEVLDLDVKVDYSQYKSNEWSSRLHHFQQAACYIASSMIFLGENGLLERPLKQEDVKPRLLGHFGTCPGLILAYSHANLAIKKHDAKMIFITGLGHGAPAILATLWLEGSLERFYPDYSRDKKGLLKLISHFSVPGGFPSHVSAEVPGSIHEGGELGYALSVAYGAVFDKPDLISVVVVGDGEAETGPTATSWHGHKYLDPRESGAVIPILHVNGFKISERTIYGCMDDAEITALFTGFGYQVKIVSDLANINAEMEATFDWAVGEIRKIQKAARTGRPMLKARFPMIVMRTPKGWTGPKSLDHEPVEGSFRSHQVPLPKAKTDAVQFDKLKEWLNSYHPHELFEKDGTPIPKVLECIPPAERLMGCQKETYNNYQPLDVPDWKKFAVDKGSQYSAMKETGKLLDAAFVANPSTLRIFSPDELVSNKLDAVFEHSHRNFQEDPDSARDGGRIIEILSEHVCQGFLQGYTLTGGTGIFPSYEAFLPIVTSMVVQYVKFLKMGMETKWRGDYSSLNYITTSTWARQEHNGFSHQSPRFISTMLSFKPRVARCYFPPDTNCFLSTMAHCLRSKNYVNLLVGSKQLNPTWLSEEEADAHCIAGASIWKFASTDDGVDPDVVLVGIGTEMTFEVITAAAMLRKDAPELRVRVVNVTDLMMLGEGHPHSLSEMMAVNRTSRFHVACAALARCQNNTRVFAQSHVLISKYQHMLQKHQQYILENADDPPGVSNRIIPTKL